ncbi:isoamylase 1 protein, partial [Thalictrum thalictroides]
MKSFVIKSRDGGGGSSSSSTKVVETVVIEKPKLRKFKVFEGSPMPFGATAKDGGVNFAVHSSGAVAATLCLISLSDLQE